MKQARLFGIREYYNVIIWNRDLPRWQVDMLRERLPACHEVGVMAISAESGNEWGAEGLNYHVASRLMWDSGQEVDALLGDFYTRCWGAAAEPMKRYYERFRGQRISTRLLALCLRDLQEATERAAGDAGVQARLDHLKLYLHWVRLYLEHGAVPANEALAATRAALHFAWRIRTTNMVHSYAQFRERRMWRAGNAPAYEWERWKISDQPEKFATEPTAGDLAHGGGEAPAAALTALDEAAKIQPPGEGLDAPPPPQAAAAAKPPPLFTHAEIAALFADDLKDCGKAVDVVEKTYSRDLVPLPAALLPKAPGDGKAPAPAAPRYRGTNRFLFTAAAGEAVALTVHPGFVRQASGTYRVTATATPDAVAAAGTVDGTEPVTLTVKPPAAGTYQLELALGGIAGKVGAGVRPLVWLLGREGNGHVIGGSGRQYFYVPPGASGFALGLASPDGHATVAIYDPAGKPALEQAGSFAGGEEFAITLAPGQDGVWSFSISDVEDATGIYLLGVPPYAATAPERLLVPQDALPAP